MINISNDQLKAFLRKNPVSISCVALCAVLGGYAFYTSDDIPEAEAELQKQSETLERHTLNVTYSTHLRDQYDQLVAAGKAAEARMVRMTALADNQRLFYRLETKTGVKLLDPRQNTTSGKLAPNTTYMPISFEVSIQGTYDRCVNFLRELESGANYTRINSVFVQPTGATPPGEDPSVAQLTMRINLDFLGMP